MLDVIYTRAARHDPESLKPSCNFPLSNMSYHCCVPDGIACYLLDSYYLLTTYVLCIMGCQNGTSVGVEDLITLISANLTE